MCCPCVNIDYKIQYRQALGTYKQQVTVILQMLQTEAQSKRSVRISDKPTWASGQLLHGVWYLALAGTATDSSQNIDSS